MAEQNSIVTQETPAPVKKKTSFVGDVIKLVSGTTFAQLLAILVVPLLSRLYKPEAFGLSALFGSIVGIFASIACMRYEFSIVLPESDQDAANLLGASSLIPIVVSILTAFALWLGGPSLSRLVNAPELTIYLWLVPPLVLVQGISTALKYWNSRTKHFGRLSITSVFSALAANGVQLGAGYNEHATASSLISATFVGSLTSTVALGVQVWRDDGLFLKRTIRWEHMLLGLKRYRKFPLYTTWAALMNNVSWQLPAFLLSAFFSSTVVGYYAVGNRLLRLPMSLIGSSIGQVFFQRAAEAKAEGTLDVLSIEAFRRLVMLGLFPFLLLTVAGQDVFTFILGAQWAEAGAYAQILSPWMFFWFISSPLSTLYHVLEKQEFGLKIDVAILISRFVSLAIGGWSGNARFTLLLFALSGIVVYGYLALAVLAFAGVSWSAMFRILLRNFLLFVPAGLIIFALRALNSDPILVVTASCLLLVLYGVYLVTADSQLRTMVLGLYRTLLARQISS